MKKLFIFAIIILLTVKSAIAGENNFMSNEHKHILISLPAPNQSEQMTLEAALQKRRSMREFSNTPLTPAQVSQLLWSAQGITHKKGYRTAPSAGALFPLTIYMIVNRVQNLENGLYKYEPKSHALDFLMNDKIDMRLSDYAYSQSWMDDAPIIILITANYEITTKKYKTHGHRYVHIEVGHAAQNLYLQSTALNLGATIVGAFDEQKIKQLLKLDSKHIPLAILPIGYPKN